MIDLDRISDGGTLLEASDTNDLLGFLDADPATSDDILLAASWCASYEGGPDDVDLLESLSRAIGFLMREHQTRLRAAQVRALRKRVAKRNGLRVTDKRVIAHVEKYLAERGK